MKIRPQRFNELVQLLESGAVMIVNERPFSHSIIFTDGVPEYVDFDGEYGWHSDKNTEYSGGTEDWLICNDWYLEADFVKNTDLTIDISKLQENLESVIEEWLDEDPTLSANSLARMMDTYLREVDPFYDNVKIKIGDANV